MNNEAIKQASAKVIPTLHIEDGLTFKDFLDENYLSWEVLSNQEKMTLISQYLAEEANADFIIEEISDIEIKVVCSRLLDQVLLPLNDIDELSGKISGILSNLFGCTYRSQ